MGELHTAHQLAVERALGGEEQRRRRQPVRVVALDARHQGVEPRLGVLGPLPDTGPVEGAVRHDGPPGPHQGACRLHVRRDPVGQGRHPERAVELGVLDRRLDRLRAAVGEYREVPFVVPVLPPQYLVQRGGEPVGMGRPGELGMDRQLLVEQFPRVGDDLRIVVAEEDGTESADEVQHRDFPAVVAEPEKVVSRRPHILDVKADRLQYFGQMRFRKAGFRCSRVHVALAVFGFGAPPARIGNRVGVFSHRGLISG